MKVVEITGLSDRKRLEIFEHVFSNKDREVAGVLIGEHFGDGSLWVAEHIAAEEADERAAAVTFTHESWDRILSIKDTDYADLEIVGWYHSHPGYGLFLSNDDMFMHRNFFPAWWQIAYVVDPINEEGGIFVWDGDDMEMFERHEATFTSSGSVPLLSVGGGSSLSNRTSRPRRQDQSPLRKDGLLLAILGVVLVTAVLALIALGAGGSEKEGTTVPFKDESNGQSQAKPKAKNEEVIDQFPDSSSDRRDYVPVAPPAPPPSWKGSSPPAGSGSPTSGSTEGNPKPPNQGAASPSGGS